MAFEKTKSAGFLVNHLARLFANQLAVEIAPLGLAPAQFMALLELWAGDGLTQSDLVERLDVEQATLANTLVRMERDGLIVRTPHPEDSRARLIWVTDLARQLEGPAKSAAARLNQQALSELDEQAAETFLSSMRVVIATLRQIRAD
ncbi:MarR family winged helix-turn-helix transcriptional regulator [Hyphomonas sp. NPDC076900]|uniref:MarR family winged helix-turn-helix transcriptional regulator n=1 Tax=unclassified Hyphomonas TaxID=2630699 RepID=UPI003D050DA4